MNVIIVKLNEMILELRNGPKYKLKVITIISIALLMTIVFDVYLFNSQKEDYDEDRFRYKVGYLSNDLYDYYRYGDINADGKSDIAVITKKLLSEEDSKNDVNRTRIDFLINMGDHYSMSDKPFYYDKNETSFVPGGFEFVDVNNDRYSDIIFRYFNDEIDGNPPGQFIYLNVNGNFIEYGNYSNSLFDPPHFQYYDLDGNNYYDFININFEDELVVYLNDGTGVFSKKYTSVRVGQYKDYFMSDFNNDGFVDIAFLQITKVGIIFNSGSGEFSQPYYFNISYDFNEIYGGDIDNDNDIDLVLSFPHSTPNNQVQVITNDGFGLFDPVNSFEYNFSLFYQLHYLKLFDLNGDSYLDLIMVEYHSEQANLVVFLSINGAFHNDTGQKYLLIGGIPNGGSFNEGKQSILCFDSDNDSIPDIVIQNIWNRETKSNGEKSYRHSKSIEILINDGDGNFS